MKITDATRAYLDQFRTGLPEYRIDPHNDPSLLNRWNPDMEYQLQADPSMGELVDGKRGTYTDGLNNYWSIRVPKDAGTDHPSFEDREIAFAPVQFCVSLGMTGWDWRNKVSRWVGFDFDAITGHAAGVGVAPEELERVREAARQIPWIEDRNSTGGSGEHLYAMLDDIHTANHHEHAALAHVILGMMSKAAGFDFGKRLDKAGGIMWVASKRATTANGGLKLIKAATSKLTKTDLPENWRTPTTVTTTPAASVPTTANHERDLDILRRSPCPPQPVAEHPGMHRINTTTLAAIDPTFRTISPGTRPSEPNGYMVAVGDGSWRVYSFAGKEHESWTHPPGGRPHIMLNPHLEVDWSMLSKYELILPELIVPPRKFLPVTFDEMAKLHPTKSPPRIDGLVRDGETMAIVADPKSNKSWLVTDMILSTCTGRPWLKHETHPCRVLLLDNELHGSILVDRIPQVAKAMGLTREDYGQGLDIISLRGRLLTLQQLGPEIIDHIQHGEYGLIVLDAFYRFSPGGKEGENSNSAMAEAFNLIDKYAKATGAAWVLVHHASKGNQTQKSVTDTGAGAGAQSRAVDAHCVLRAHEDPEHVVMEARVRSFMPPKPKVLRWDFPLWSVVEDADPTALRDPTRMSSTGKAERHRKHIVKAVTDQPDSLSSLKLRLKGMVPRDDIAVLLGQLVVEGVLTITPGRKANNRCDIYSLVTA